ncbi:MAG: DUF362 domain-containing protein [Armatimonadetes bacterium]|nr:DUF362 domain-containing protein [Armatimonadota bacterium]
MAAQLPKVYWASCDHDEAGHPLQKFRRLVELTGFLKQLHRGDVVAIKLHMGEHGNVRYLRPIWARTIADMVKEAGGRPFVTDTTTLYRHKRATLHDYLETAAMHGYTPESMGCPIIIADGFRNSGTVIRLEGAEYKEVPVAQALYEADALVSLAHPTFHPDIPIAGTLKNLGMGGTTKQAKIAMHTKDSAPVYKAERCIGCWTCIKICPGHAFKVAEGGKRVDFDPAKCLGCGDCVAHCPSGALSIPWDADAAVIQRWTLDAAKAVMSTFASEKIVHLAVGFDFTVPCDCISASALPAVVDIGLFASSDGAALDKACWDKAHEVAIYPGSKLDKIAASPEAQPIDLSNDRASPLWSRVQPERFWNEIVPAAGVGSVEYELVELGPPG